ncbi:MAG: sensor domain-containing diguanylate cyclase [Actinobacteria bacterium]|nr:sensor domain-containing diguanylate cyclase [Actinomycetota bacterium]
MSESPRRGAQIVDGTGGPLVGAGRLRTVLPFAVTATISMIVAIPATSWDRPHLALVGSILSVATMIGSMVFPWHRVPRHAQLMPPLLFLAATLLMASATSYGIGSPFVTMAVLPLMWLAIYENRTAVLSAATLTGVTLWLTAPDSNVEKPINATISTVVFVVCAAGMGVTLHGLVAGARRLALTLHDQQHALEQAALMMNSLPERVNRYRVSDHVITYCNAAWATQYNVELSQAIGRRLDDFLSEDELEGMHTQLALLSAENATLVDPIAREANNSPGQWLEWADQYLTDGGEVDVLSVGRDVTARHRAEVLQAESEARYRDLADKSADVVWRVLVEPSPHFDYMSPSIDNILGYPPLYFLEDFTRILDVLDDAGKTAIARALNGEQIIDRFDFRFRHANGSTVVGETRTTLIRGGVQGVSRDVTELRQLQDKMAALALRDPLTGLANRRLLDELLDVALTRTRRSGQALAVAFFDLDGFKEVNDNYGHDAGDVVLCETARRLLANVRGADAVARVGGDEFAIAYELTETGSNHIIQRIDRALSAPINIAPDTVVSCPASIGVADTRTVGYNGAALIAAADKAMYEVKRNRKSVRES